MSVRAIGSTWGLSRSRVASFLVAGALASGSSAGWAEGLFGDMGGDWRGEGSIGWSTGETERLRCNAKYEVENEGNKIKQELTCATDSTRLIVKSTISYNPDAGALTGSWSETTYGINGYVSGRASAGNIHALVESTDKRFTADVSLVMSGGVQTVTIRPQGLEVTEVSVTLRKSG